MEPHRGSNATDIEKTEVCAIKTLSVQHSLKNLRSQSTTGTESTTKKQKRL